MITSEQLIKSVETKGYKVFKKRDYNINLIGCRSVANQNGEMVKNIFNDSIFVLYKRDKQWQVFKYIATTVPGLTYFKTPMMKEFGTAIMKPGQYFGAYSLGYHFAQPALVQVGTVSLYRDTDRDNIIDISESTVQSGNWMGINIHYSWDNKTVDNFSAGCQVLGYNPTNAKYIEFLNHFRMAIQTGQPNLFTYTLIEEQDLIL